MKFLDALKTVYGPQSSETTPLLNADGTSLLTDREAILKKWAEYVDGVLNRPSSIMMKLSKDYHRWKVKAIKLLSSDKAPGSDAIPAEICKTGGPPVAEKLTVISNYLEKRSHPSNNSRKQQLSTYSKRKGILKSVTLIEVSLYCKSLGRSCNSPTESFV